MEHPDSSQNPTMPVSADTSTLRRCTRLRKASPKQLVNGGPKRSSDESPKRSVSRGSYYYWIDYRVEVEFKDGMMSYQLLIDDVEDQSFKGTVTLGPSIEAWEG